jgi:hypothetical protein
MAENQNTLPQGVLVSGICKGIREDVFNNNTNYYLGLDVESTDQYGQKRVDLEEVSIFGDSLQTIREKAQTLIGKHVVISVIKRAMKSERTGNPYMRTMIHRDSKLQAIS